MDKSEVFLVFGNVGFIGIPIADALYGPLGVFYMAILNIPFNVLCYTYGLWLITKDCETGYRFSVKKLINTGMICIVVSLIVFLLDIQVPQLVISPFSFIGDLTAPVAMLILGSSVAGHDLKKVFTNWRLYVITIVKMILFPIAAFLIMGAVLGPCMLTTIVTLHVGMPTAMLASLFAMAYGGDEETATAGVAMMNIFCIITIPCMYLLTSTM